MPFLDIHVLQTVPPANLNRDDSGSPKTAYYGGVRRARVSSQAWKRAVRGALSADPALAAEAGRRTQRLPQVIGDRLAERRQALAPYADAIGEATASAMFKVKSSTKKGKDGSQSRPATDYLLFLGDAQVDRVVERLLTRTGELVAAEGDAKRLGEIVDDLDLKALGMTGHPGAVALFGRMVADAPDTNVDAACQVAHAISTHQVVDEYDYFTAVDDEAQDDETGASMIGTVEFNSATLYRYATVDLRELVANLDGEAERALDLAIAFARAFAVSMPTGKRNTFANNTRPDLVLLCVREDQPVSLVGAFEEPVRAAEGGLVADSAARLFTYLHDQDAMYDTRPALTVAAYPAWLAEQLSDRKSGVELPEAKPLGAALAQARTTLAELTTARVPAA